MCYVFDQKKEIFTEKKLELYVKNRMKGKRQKLFYTVCN